MQRQKRLFFLLSAALSGVVGAAVGKAFDKREFVPDRKISSNGLETLKGLNRTPVDGIVKGEILKEAVMEEILEEIVEEKILEEVIKENILKAKVEESGEGKVTPGAKERSE